jgi:NADH-quinone oxidoreductase subunit C
MSQPPAAQPAPPKAPAPKPEPVRAKELAAKIAARFPEAKADWMKERRLKVTVPASRIAEAALFVRDELGFGHISAVSGVDWIAAHELEVVYFAGSVNDGWLDFVVALAERLPRGNPVAPTLTSVWPGAEFHERETHEMFGINFQGHPNLSHLLLPEDWNDLPPLRKDYVSPGR